MDWWGFFIFFSGSLFAVSALFNLGWLMKSRRSRFISHYITETGTRLFYVMTGMAFVVMAILRIIG